MKEEELSKIFRVFGRLQSTNEINKTGMGLGLSVSKLIVDKLGGDFRVSSKLLMGSTFSFSIRAPVIERLGSWGSGDFSTTDANIHIPFMEPFSRRSHRDTNCRVLIADDQAYNIYVLKEMIEEIV